MKKRNIIILIIALFLIPLCLRAKSPSGNDLGKPNILFILVDDMGWKDVGYAGSKYYLTPNIDKLASEGVWFTNANSAACVCSPSRGAIFSGKYPARTQLTTVWGEQPTTDDRLYEISKYQGGNDQYLEALQRHALPSTEFLFPEALSKGGYKTGFFGKWHIGNFPGYYPDERGFQVAKGYKKGFTSGYDRAHYGKNWVKGTFANLPDPEPEEFITDILTRECIHFIEENQKGPFLAFLSLYIVHAPITPKPEKVQKYLSRTSDDQNNPEYAALVESVDETVGLILEKIKKLGIERNTIVIFTSDNGGLSKFTSGYPLMGGKSFSFEAGTRVPLIVKWPGKIEPGVSSENVIATDFYPTLLSAAGLPLLPEQHLDGQNLIPLLTRNKPLEKRPLVFHFPHYTGFTGPFSTIIEDGWKLIRFYNDEEGEFLLYDLNNDPEEQYDLASKEIALREQLNEKLDRSLLEMKAQFPVKNQNYNPNSAGKRMNLKFTKALAEQQRAEFESRLNNTAEK